MTIFKEYGIDGIRKLKENVIRGYHPSEMVQMAGRNLSEAPAISVMPYFYANLIQNKRNVKIIWPEEGAIVSPITMLIKKNCEERLKNIIDFFISDKSRKLFEKANFITPNEMDVNKRFKGKNYYWPGWDYIKENDIKKIVNNLNEEFKK